MVGLIAPAYELVHPSYTIPDFVMPISQASGAFSLLDDGNPEVRIGTTDLVVYAKVMDIRTKETVSQSAGNQMQSISLTNKMISVPTYMIRLNGQYDHHDSAAAGTWGFGLPQALELGHEQATFQQMRNGLLYGFSPGNGEGLVNAVGITAVTLPADQYGNNTILTIDNGFMAFYLAQLIQTLKTRMNQMGKGCRVVVCGPQRSLGPFEYNIVQLVQMQREGAGSMSTKGTFEEILKTNQDVLEWTYDDTLQGQGTGGTSNSDAIMIIIPEIDTPHVDQIDTNKFAGFQPNMRSNTKMLCDMPSPRQIISPIAHGGTDVVAEMRTTPGWDIRPESTIKLSVAYA
jgi:hypothetical protein